MFTCLSLKKYVLEQKIKSSFNIMTSYVYLTFVKFEEYDNLLSKDYLLEIKQIRDKLNFIKDINRRIQSSDENKDDYNSKDHNNEKSEKCINETMQIYEKMPIYAKKLERMGDILINISENIKYFEPSRIIDIEMYESCAIQLYEESAVSLPSSMNKLGLWCKNHEKNYKKAREYFELASNLQCVDASYNLEIMHLEGLCVDDIS